MTPARRMGTFCRCVCPHAGLHAMVTPMLACVQDLAARTAVNSHDLP